MGESLLVLLLLMASDAVSSAPQPKSPDGLADLYAKAILASQDDTGVRRRLHDINPEIGDPSQVLPSLFARIAGGGASDSQWAALCRIDTWGDGAWHLEMKGSAFDGLALNPAVFAQRYLEGDDCALLLLLYAYAWPIEAPQVGGIECSPDGIAEAQRFLDVVRQSIAAITGLLPRKADAKAERRRILLGVDEAMDNTIYPTVQRFRESCKGATK